MHGQLLESLKPVCGREEVFLTHCRSQSSSPVTGQRGEDGNRVEVTSVIRGEDDRPFKVRQVVEAFDPQRKVVVEKGEYQECPDCVAWERDHP